MSTTRCAYRLARALALTYVAACGGDTTDARDAGLDLCAYVACSDGMVLADAGGADPAADTSIDALDTALVHEPDAGEALDAVEDSALSDTAVDATDAGPADPIIPDSGSMSDAVLDATDVGPADVIAPDSGSMTDAAGGSDAGDATHEADAVLDAGDAESADTRDIGRSDAEGEDAGDTTESFDASDGRDAADVADADDGSLLGDVDGQPDAEDARDDTDASLDAGLDAGDATDGDDAGDVADSEDDGDDVDGDAVTDADSIWDGTPRLIRIDVGALGEHDPAVPGVAGNDFAYGYGMTPFDADGDGDLDLFVGTLPASTLAACVYENASTPGSPTFVRRPEWCAPAEQRVTAAVAADVDGDGVQELVAMSDDGLWAVRLEPSWTGTAMAGAHEDCTFGAATFVDADSDGVLELQTACIADFRGRRGPELPGTRWQYAPDLDRWAPDSSVFAIEEHALSLATTDADGDGLLDIVTVVDAFATPETVVRSIDPGGVHRRCRPDEGCTSVVERFDPGLPAWGSFMGFERLPGSTPRFVLGNIGPFGAFARGDAGFASADLRLPRAFFGESTGQFLFSWSVLADDWDDDGDVDLLATFGHFAVQQGAFHLEHADRVFLADETGALTPSDAPEFRFEDPHDHLDGATGEPRTSRAAIRFDVDLDGSQEVIVAAANGPPFVYRHEGVSPRCTLRPASRYVASAGAGFAWRGRDGVWWPGPTGGEVLSSDSPWVLAPATGTLEFPSGYRVPYHCGDAATLDVAEPEWLHVIADEGGVLRVLIDRRAAPGAGLDLRVAVETDAGVILVTPEADAAHAAYTARLPDGALRAMVEIDRRWIGRWFELSE